MAPPVDVALREFEAHLREHQRYLLTTHIGPDGDGLGSALALSALIRARGADAQVVIVDPLPERYAFMLEGFPEGTLASYPQEVDREHLAGFDAIVLMDCGVWTRLGPLLDAVDLDSKATVCFDHHISDQDPAALTILDETATATASLIYRLYQALDEPVTLPAARALYVALMTETGSFRFSNTDPEVHRVVADLMETGLKPHEVYIEIYENRAPAALRITGHGLAGFETAAEGKVVLTKLPFTLFEELGACSEDADGLVNQILALETAEVAILAYEKAPGTVKLSFRAKHDADVQVVAAQFGGGGHRKAAGATVEGAVDEVAARAVAAAVEAVQDLA